MKNNMFRGKRIDNNEWIYGSLVILSSDEVCIFNSKDLKDSIVKWIKSAKEIFIGIDGFAGVDPKTVGGYTGLRDVNNKKIYIGDIILFPSICKDKILEDGSGPEAVQFQFSEVVKQDGCFGIITKKDELFNNGFYSFREIKKDIGIKMKEIKIIGNIYDNPELLPKRMKK